MFGLRVIFGEDRLLAAINDLKEQLTMTESEFLAALAEVKAQVDAGKQQLEHVRAEVAGKIADLENALSQQGSTTPAIDAALAGLKGSVAAEQAAVQAVDDILPDPVPQPIPPTAVDQPAPDAGQPAP